MFWDELSVWKLAFSFEVLLNMGARAGSEFKEKALRLTITHTNASTGAEFARLLLKSGVDPDGPYER